MLLLLLLSLLLLLQRPNGRVHEILFQVLHGSGAKALKPAMLAAHSFQFRYDASAAMRPLAAGRLAALLCSRASCRYSHTCIYVCYATAILRCGAC